MKLKWLFLICLIGQTPSFSSEPAPTKDAKMLIHIPSNYHPKTVGAITTWLMRFPSFGPVANSENSTRDTLFIVIEALPAFRSDSMAEQTKGERLVHEALAADGAPRPEWSKSSDGRVLLYRTTEGRVRSIYFKGEDEIWRDADIRRSTFTITKIVRKGLRLTYQAPIELATSASLIDYKVTEFVKGAIK